MRDVCGGQPWLLALWTSAWGCWISHDSVTSFPRWLTQTGSRGMVTRRGSYCHYFKSVLLTQASPSHSKRDVTDHKKGTIARDHFGDQSPPSKKKKKKSQPGGCHQSKASQTLKPNEQNRKHPEKCLMGQKVWYAKFKDILLSVVRGVRNSLVPGGWRAKGRAKKWEDRPARGPLNKAMWSRHLQRNI